MLVNFSLILTVCACLLKAVKVTLWERGLPKLHTPESQGESLKDPLLGAPTIDDISVPEISSVYVPELQASIDEAETQKRKEEYTALSAEDLKIDVQMGTIESSTKYAIAPPRSTCDEVTGAAKKLLECKTTVPPIQIGGFQRKVSMLGGE